MINKYNNSTTIRLDPEIKTWLLQLSQKQNRSLSNLINTILINDKERRQTDLNTIIEMPTIDGKMDYITVPNEVK